MTPADPSLPVHLPAPPASRVRRRLRIAAIGEFSSGKSTLLNTLLGNEVLAVGPNPTTDRALVLTADGETDRDWGAAAVRRVDGRLFELGLELWDSPGVNVEQADHEARSREVVAAADIVLIVVRSDDASTRSARSLAARVDRDCPARAPHPVVVTRADQIDSDDEEEQREELEEKRQEVLEGFGRRKVFLVDARSLDRLEGLALTTAIEGWVEAGCCAALEQELASPDHWMRVHLECGGAWADALPTRRPLPVGLRDALDGLQETRDRALATYRASVRQADQAYRGEVRRAVMAEAGANLGRVAREHAIAGRAVFEAARVLLADARATTMPLLRTAGWVGAVWLAFLMLAGIALWQVAGGLPPAVTHDPTVGALRRDPAVFLGVAWAAGMAPYLALRAPRLVMPSIRLVLVVLASLTSWALILSHTAADALHLASLTVLAWARAGARLDWRAYLHALALRDYRGALGRAPADVHPPVVKLLSTVPSSRARARGQVLATTLATRLLPGAGTIVLFAVAVVLASRFDDPHPPPEPVGLMTLGLPWGLVVPGVGEVRGPASLRLVPLRGGAFEMGASASDGLSAPDERRHPVVLSRSFLLSDAEVTQGEWEAVMGTRPWKTRPRFWQEETSSPDACSNFDGADLPSVCVSWLDALAFCNALSDLAGLEHAYEIGAERVTWRVRADGYRLPTEAEWELAARGGTEDPWGRTRQSQDICAVGVVLDASTHRENDWIKAAPAECDDGFPEVAPAAMAPSNAFGLRGLVGNVSEWVFDGYGEYGTADVDPAGPRAAPTRVIRGGAWFEPVEDARVSNRAEARAAGISTNVGFRVARGPSGVPSDVEVELPGETTMAAAWLAAQDAASVGARDAERAALGACVDHPRLGGTCRLRLGQIEFEGGRWAEAVAAWAPVRSTAPRSVRTALGAAERALAGVPARPVR